MCMYERISAAVHLGVLSLVISVNLYLMLVPILLILVHAVNLGLLMQTKATRDSKNPDIAVLKRLLKLPDYVRQEGMDKKQILSTFFFSK